MIARFPQPLKFPAERLKRPFQFFLACFIAAVLPMPQANAETLELWHRPGGYTHLHIAEANRWLAKGTRLVIRDWQVSAAAIQIVYFKRKGGRVCYAKAGFNAEPALYFHLGTSQGTPHNTLASYLGAANAEKVGKLSGHGFRRMHPSAFGIRSCRDGTKGNARTRAQPSLLRW